MVMVGLAYGVLLLVHYREIEHRCSTPPSLTSAMWFWLRDRDSRAGKPHVELCKPEEWDVTYNRVAMALRMPFIIVLWSKEISQIFASGFCEVQWNLFVIVTMETALLRQEYVNSWLLPLDRDQVWLQWPLWTLFTVLVNHICWLVF